MRVLGPALITAAQQDRLIEGALLNIPATAVYESAAQRARVGDRFWVREPYVEITPKRYGCPSYVHAVCPGHSPHKITIPDDVKKFLQNCNLDRRDGSDMRRTQSRARLEIVQVLAEQKMWRCKVSMGNVDGESEAA